MKKIGCSKRKTWCEEEEGIIYCENCGCMYDSRCHCIGVEFIYEETEEDKINKIIEILQSTDLSDYECRIEIAKVVGIYKYEREHVDN